MKSILCLLCFGIAVAQQSPYRPRGWRPSGESFNPSRLQSYGPPPSQNYGPPPSQNYGPPKVITIPTTTTTTTTEAPTTTTVRTTTTPRSREPTTPSEEEFASGPALAIANSFAFNRPVYVYNSFPFYSGYTLLK